MRLTDFKVLTFDCYGTLIDWESGIWNALQPALDGRVDLDLGRDRALEAFAEARVGPGGGDPRPAFIRRSSPLVHRQLAEHWGLETTPVHGYRLRRLGARLAGLSGLDRRR